MKKIIGVLAIVLIVVGGYFGYRYYADTYKSDVAYAVVPTEVPQKEATLDSHGKKVDGLESYNYTLNFVKEDGQKETLGFEISGENVTPLAPGAIIKASISKTRVTEGPSVVEESQVPQKVLSNLGK